MATAINGQLYGPEETDGTRSVINLVTTSDNVVVDSSTNLTQALSQVKLQISDTKPSFACLWGRVKSTEA